MIRPSQRVTRGIGIGCLAIAVVILAGDVFAQAAKSTTPAVGDKAPDFTLQALDGRQVTLSRLTADSTVVLVVLRGYPGYQCPICSAQVGDLVGRAKEFTDANAKVVLIYPGPAEKLTQRATEFLKARSLSGPFVMVTDPDYQFTSAYGLRWDAPRETAYPATLIIDRSGIIRLAKVSRTHGDRASADDILKALADAK